MKHLVAILLTIASLLGLSACTVESQAPVQHSPSTLEVAPKGSPLDPPTVVTAPKVTLASVEVEVLTTPAPAATIPAPAPVCMEDMPCWDCATMGNLQCGPITPALTAQAPICYEDMACWDCATMGNMVCGPAPALVPATWVDPYSGNSETASSCASQGKVLAEDYTCVTVSFHASKPVQTVQPVVAPAQPAVVVEVPPTVEDTVAPEETVQPPVEVTVPDTDTVVEPEDKPKHKHHKHHKDTKNSNGKGACASHKNVG